METIIVMFMLFSLLFSGWYETNARGTHKAGGVNPVTRELPR